MNRFNALRLAIMTALILFLTCLPFVTHSAEIVATQDLMIFAPVAKSSDPQNNGKLLAIVLSVIGGITLLGLVIIVLGAVGYIYMKQRSAVTSYGEL